MRVINYRAANGNGLHNARAVLAQCEHELGRFLKANSEADKSRAGRMMLASGRAFCAASQSRVTLRVPLERLAAEVDTFRVRSLLVLSEHSQRSRVARSIPTCGCLSLVEGRTRGRFCIRKLCSM